MPFNDLPLIAGSASTLIFVASYLPMLVKAVRTKDLTSYSPTILLLANLGNAVHSVYVYSLPIGPIWVLHSFYVVTSALMFVWYLRFTRSARRRAQVGQSLPDRSSRIGGTRPIAPIAMGAGLPLRTLLDGRILLRYPLRLRRLIRRLPSFHGRRPQSPDQEPSQSRTSPPHRRDP